MSGHNKWSSIKHRKGAQDAKRSKVFTKLIKELTVAARMGGDDVSANPRLRAAIAAGKAANMPNDNVKRAIQKGAGGAKGDDYEGIIYEGYGPQNVAVIVECLTDNRNRTVSNVRTIFNKNGGSMGSSNSVMFNFNQIGVIEVSKSAYGEDEIMELAVDAGALEIDLEGDEVYEVQTEMSDLHAVQSILEEKGVEVVKSSLVYQPVNKAEVDDVEQAQGILRLLEALDDDDDVQDVFSNVDFSDEVLSKLDGE